MSHFRMLGLQVDVDAMALDGLGAGGGLAHNPGEFIELDYVPTRIALAAGLVRRLGRN